MGRTIGTKTYPGTNRRLSERLTQAEKDSIIRQKKKGVKNTDLAQQFGVSRGTMDRCVRDIVLLEDTKSMAEAKLPPESDLKKLMSLPGAKAAISAISERYGLTPQQSSQKWLTLLDRFAEAGIGALQRRYDPRYEGIEDLGLGYASSGDVCDGKSRGPTGRGVDWLVQAISEEEWSAKELTQLMIMQAKLYAEIMPYHHPKLSTVEPTKKSAGLENLSREERQAKIKELGAKLGFEIKEAQK